MANAAFDKIVRAIAASHRTFGSGTYRHRFRGGLTLGTIAVSCVRMAVSDAVVQSAQIPTEPSTQCCCASR